ncbi:MAG: HD-GYP domain-containing protein [Solirubrobacterales bacterium]|nr:HD-GYP domain-containing protein [Solirubrobacterales bacterium]
MVGFPTLHRGDRRAATAVLAVGLVACVAVAVVQADTRSVDAKLAAALLISAVIAGFAVVRTSGRAVVSASFIVAILAAAFLGPSLACLCAVIAECVAARTAGTRRYVFAFNLFGAMASALVGANLIRALEPNPVDTASFYAVVAAGGAVAVVMSFAIVAPYYRLWSGSWALNFKVFWEYTPSQAISIALAVAGAAIYLKVGLRGIVFALVALFAFSYMAHLLEQSRHRAQQYVSLSWGVLAGLLRSLDTRDQRSARHAAAVARFARDIAMTVGMSEEESELAHTAGLLHDIGRFALSDRVAERGRTLTEEDWMAIQRHPELGADMLRDLGMYGPVAAIVLAHHERVDGRGYPHGLTGEQIPEIAKIIAVAEVYDTLTASDTYRTRMSSFEALRELRRVADTQLDARYVEVLAQLLSGEGVEYRHADAADFDSELDMERRTKEAGAGA